MNITYDIDEINSDGQLRSAVTIGKFDGIHKGHQLLIKKAVGLKKEGLTSVVCIIDMQRPGILSHDERIEILNRMKVDWLIILRFTDSFARQTPEEFISGFLKDKLGAEKIIVGNDFRFGHNREGNVNTLKQFEKKYGYSCEFYEKLEYDRKVISSTYVRDALGEGDMETVRNLLGRRFSIKGEIVHGNHLGRNLGFPTINIPFAHDKYVPRKGVYSSLIMIGDKVYRGITNIGNKPTIGDYPASSETFIFDFDDDVYGKQAEIYPIDFIRDEKKFTNITELTGQLAEDTEKVKACNFPEIH